MTEIYLICSCCFSFHLIRDVCTHCCQSQIENQQFRVNQSKQRERVKEIIIVEHDVVMFILFYTSSLCFIENKRRHNDHCPSVFVCSVRRTRKKVDRLRQSCFLIRFLFSSVYRTHICQNSSTFTSLDNSSTKREHCARK